MPTFKKSVFVNCPFDLEYKPFFEALVFTIQYLGLIARTSYEASDAGEPRISKLIRIMAGSKYGVHDLSRCRATKRGEYYRLNMPLELGVDLGCKKFGNLKQKRKRILVLDKHPYRLQKALSDLSGSDVKEHNNSVLQLVRVVSDWLTQTARVSSRSSNEIRTMQLRFEQDYFEQLVRQRYSLRDISKRSAHLRREAMIRWIKKHKPHKAGQY